MVNLRKLCCSMVGSLVLILGSAGVGVRVFAAEEEPAEATEATAETSVQEEAELFESGCAYADSGDEFFFSASKTRYEMGEKIVVAIHTDPSDEIISVEHTARGFRVSKPKYIAEDQFEITLTHDLDYIEPQFTLTVKTESGDIQMCHLYGLYTECGLFVSTASLDSAWDAYYYNLYEAGIYTWEEYNEALCKMYSQNIETNDALLPALQQNQTASVSSGITTVTGVLTWIDDSEVEHPLQYTKVEIRDAYTESLYGTTYTDVNGAYSFKRSDTASRNFYIKIYAAGENTAVKTVNGGDYAFISPSNKTTAGGGTCIINAAVNMDDDIGQALQISQAVITADRYATAMNGSALSKVTVKYPDNDLVKEPEKAGCWYENNALFICKRNDKVYLGFPASHACWDAIMHEYGHHIANKLGIDDSPGGTHFIDENLLERVYTINDNDEQRYYTKSEAIRLAWNEGIASVFSGMAQAYFATSLQNIRTVGDTAYLSYNGTKLDYEATTGVAMSEACEGAVIGVLWDLYDPANESHDTLAFGHKFFWDFLKGSKAKTLSAFAQYFYSKRSQDEGSHLGKILGYYGIAAFGISAPTIETSHRIYWMSKNLSSRSSPDVCDVVFYDLSGKEIGRVTNQTAGWISILPPLWEKIPIGKSYVQIVSYQNDSPKTGPYYSERYVYSR